MSPRGRARNRKGAQDVESWARTTNMLQVASGHLGRSRMHRSFLRDKLISASCNQLYTDMTMVLPKCTEQQKNQK